MNEHTIDNSELDAVAREYPLIHEVSDEALEAAAVKAAGAGADTWHSAPGNSCVHPLAEEQAST